MDRLSIWKNLRPAVPKRWLFAIVAVIWTGVGVLLCGRAILWIEPMSIGREILAEAGGLLIAIPGYSYLFTKIVQKNIDRIHRLPDPACAFAFAAWRGYFMIGLMVTLGIALRNSTIPKFYLAFPYTAMGGMLLIGSVNFYGQFLAYTTRSR